jgi:hypothetical protein
MTVGVAQKEVRVGMSQADVAAALGSPNIVTKDSEDKETWVYDKIAAEVAASRDAVGTGIILSLFGIYWREAAAASHTQKTLTVVIKFDSNNLVESFTYHTSKFSWNGLRIISSGVFRPDHLSIAKFHTTVTARQGLPVARETGEEVRDNRHIAGIDLEPGMKRG